MSGKYILNDAGEPEEASSLLAWAKWFETADRIVASDIIGGDVHVSTVFLGLDHNFGSAGAPLLYETMIFGGEHDGYEDRYSSRVAALAGHADALKMAGAHE